MTTDGRTAAFDHALDEVLRSPLDQIIESASGSSTADGPLRSDYAGYYGEGDIAAAADICSRC